MDGNVFSSLDHLEPKCKSCGIKIDYDVTTKFDEKKQKVVCIKCGNII